MPTASACLELQSQSGFILLAGLAGFNSQSHHPHVCLLYREQRGNLPCNR